MMPICLCLLRKVEGEIFKVEMLLEDVKEKIDEGKQTSVSSLPVSSPTILNDLASTPSPPANEVIQPPAAYFHARKSGFCAFIEF